MLNQTKKCTIMLLDNKQGILYRFKNILEQEGLNVVLAFDQLALHILDKERPDLVLLNADVSKDIGINFLNIVKTKYPTLPIIIHSTSNFLPKEIFARLRATDCLHNPLNKNVLLIKISHALKGMWSPNEEEYF